MAVAITNRNPHSEEGDYETAVLLTMQLAGARLETFFLLRLHPKHSDKRQTKARGYSGRRSIIYESEYKAKKN